MLQWEYGHFDHFFLNFTLTTALAKSHIFILICLYVYKEIALKFLENYFLALLFLFYVSLVRCVNKLPNIKLSLYS